MATSSQQLYPLQWIEETVYGELVTSPGTGTTAVGVAGDVTRTIDGVKIESRQAGSYYLYSLQSAGHDFGFDMDVDPFDIGILKYGTDPINNPASIQMYRVYKQAEGTNALNTYYENFLGARCNTVSLSVTGRDLLHAKTSWLCRDITKPVQTSPFVSFTPKQFSSITGSIISNIDAGYKQLVIGGTSYGYLDFNINWDNGLFRVPAVGAEQGLAEQIVQGPIKVTGSVTFPAGVDLVMEAKTHDFPETPVSASAIMKTGVMKINMSGWQTLSRDNPILAQPNDILKNTINFQCVSATLSTS